MMNYVWDFSQLETEKYFECLNNNISIVKLILIFSLKGVLFPCSGNTPTRIRCNQWKETKKNCFCNLSRTYEPSTHSLFPHLPSTGCLGQTPPLPLLNVCLKFCCHKSHCIPEGILTYTWMVLLSIKLCHEHRSTHNIKFMKMDQFAFVQKCPSLMFTALPPPPLNIQLTSMGGGTKYVDSPLVTQLE